MKIEEYYKVNNVSEKEQQLINHLLSEMEKRGFTMLEIRDLVVDLKAIILRREGELLSSYKFKAPEFCKTKLK